ncbi:MAG: hypothetical protein HQM00_10180, partial [Magnetococcales bacterium]|nr:hypothetical protein [Magnetococcales bacterium]
MNPNPPRLTLIITRATLPDNWSMAIDHRLGAHWRAALFFTHHGIHQVSDAGWNARIPPGGEAAYCAQSHERAGGPPPISALQP